MTHRTILLLVLLLLSAGQAAGQRVMWWNVENLFDCRHDSLKDDLEFLPESSRHWTRSRYWRKLDNIARTLAAASYTSWLRPVSSACRLSRS